MRLWKVTHKGDGRVLFVLADRWFDVRNFAAQELGTGGDYAPLLVEQAAPFPKETKKLKVPAFRLDWLGHAAGRVSTVRLEAIKCKTVKELYGEHTSKV